MPSSTLHEVKPFSLSGMQGAVWSWKGTGGGQAAAQGTTPARIQPRGVPSLRDTDDSSLPSMPFQVLFTWKAFQGFPPLFTCSCSHYSPCPPHPHTCTQSHRRTYRKKKISEPSPSPILKCQVSQFWEKKKAEESMTHDRADKQLSGGMLVSHGMEICLYAVEKTRIAGASWDQPVKFHYSLKPIWKSLKNPGLLSALV